MSFSPRTPGHFPLTILLCGLLISVPSSLTVPFALVASPLRAGPGPDEGATSAGPNVFAGVKAGAAPSPAAAPAGQTPSATPAPAEQNLESAIQAFERSDLARAAALVKAYLAGHPKSAAAWNLRGLIEDSQRRFDEGERSFQEALRLSPSASVYNNLGNHHLLVHRPAEAAKNFQQALRLEPGHFPSRLSLISLFAEGQGCSSGAASDCAREALALFEGFTGDQQKLPEVEALRARALLAAGEKEHAFAAATSAVAANSGNARLAYTLGSEFQKAGEPAAAVTFFQQALSAQPELQKDFGFRLELATAKYQAHQPARGDFLELAELQPKAWQPDYYLGRIAEDSKQYLEASTWLVKAQELAPGEPVVAAALANVAARQQFYLDAVDEWQRYLRLRPQDAKAFRALAVVAALGRLHDLAVKSIQRYLAAYPDDAEGQYFMALMEQDAGQAAEAKKALDASLRLNPANAPAWTTRGSMAMRENDLAGAAEDLRQALQVDGRYVPALVAAAELHARQGHSELALPLLEQAVKLDPQNVTATYQLALAYRRTGNLKQADQASAVFKRLEAAGNRSQGARGLLEYLRTDVPLTPAERREHYLQFLKNSLKDRPDNPRILARLGAAELGGGETAAALATLKSALQPSLPYEDALSTARALVASHQPQLALKFYDQALTQAPAQTDASAALEKAQLLLRLGLAHQALEVLDAVPAQAEPKGQAADLAGLVYARLGEDAEALAAFRVALSLAPRQPAIYRDTAIFLASREQWNDALKLLEVAESRCSASPLLTLNKAILLQLSGRAKEAQAALESLAFHADDPALTPDQRLAALLLGISYYTTDQRGDAARVFEELTQVDPKLAPAWYYRALIASERKPQEALKWVSRSLEFDPRYAQALYLRGKLLKQAGRLKEARRDLEAAAAVDSEWSSPHYLLGQIYRQQGNTARARQEQKLVERLNARPQASQSADLRDFLSQMAIGANP